MYMLCQLYTGNSQLLAAQVYTSSIIFDLGDWYSHLRLIESSQEAIEI